MTITANARPATVPMLRYIHDLAVKLELAPGDVDADVLETAFDVIGNEGSDDPKFISFAEARKALDVLIPLHRAREDARRCPVRGLPELGELLKQINPGRYALPRKKDGVIDCFEVVERKDGRRFLNQLLGGNVAGTKFHRKHLPIELQAAAARAILGDQKAAARLYADTYCECPRCGVALTHPRSRTARIGEVCAKAWGWTW